MSVAITKAGTSLVLTDSATGAIKYLPSPVLDFKPSTGAGTFDVIIFRSGPQLEAVNITRISTIDGANPAATPAQIMAQIATLQNSSVGSVAGVLPSGAATEIKQDEGNLYLSKTLDRIGSIADDPAISDTGSFTIIAFIKRALTNWTNLLGIIPVRKTAGGHIALQTDAAGTDFVAFSSQACTQLTIVNDTGVNVEVKQGSGTIYLPVISNMAYKFEGITNANQLSVRRFDQNVAQVTVKARWES